MIELDVQLSRDGVLVVLHDLDLQRTTGVAGAVRERSFAEMKMLDAGRWYGAQFSGQPVLSLDEVIDIVDTHARLNIELKAPEVDWPLLATTLTDTLRRRGLLETSIISCFEPAALEVVHEYDADARLGLLWQRTEFEEVWAWTRRLKAVSFHPHWLLVSTELVGAAHARGLQVITWTVNDIEAMCSLVRQGVDGLISDYPERFAAVRN